MLSDFRKKKLTHLFKVFDLNDNGFISLEDDFIRYLTRLVEEDVVEANSEKYERMKSESVALWNDLREYADQDRDEKVSLDEWLAWQNALDDKVESGATFPFEQYFSTMFSIIDVNNSGFVSLDEYLLMLKIYDVELDDAKAEEFFKLFDKSGNGSLSREEVAEINANYWYGDDPDAPDKYLFGPLS